MSQTHLCRRGCQCIAALVFFIVKFLLYFVLWFHAETGCIWNYVFEGPADWVCSHPELPANQSGVQVIVVGLAKCGTRSMSRALYQLGFDHSYHGEELGLHVWSPVADEFWQRPENGGLRLAPPAHLFSGISEDSQTVLSSLHPEAWAGALSRCKTDAVAFDGLEKLMMPTLDVSPGAKVILLSWRTWDEWLKSHMDFTDVLLLSTTLLGFAQGSFAMLPWGV
ncbi:unnamed protein product, partial [Polarella glacialis]